MPTAIVPDSTRQGAHVVEMQRRRLLWAMVEVLCEHGLEDAQVGRVCKRAGVSRRTFYDLFVDREACFLAAFELAIEQIAERIVPRFAGDGRWRERIRAGLTALLELLDEEPGLARLCVVETLKGDPRVIARRREVIETLIAAIDEGRREARTVQPPALTAESTVGGAISVIHARLLEHEHEPLVGLVNPLMSMIAHPYLGGAAARKELEPTVTSTAPRALHEQDAPPDPFKDLPIRITFRTARVLDTIGARPGASNRETAEAAGVSDPGQMSKLLRRLEKAGLIDNSGEGQSRGEANAWRLSPRGQAILHAVGSEIAGQL
ncbi:MAG: TetR family transcriptional regulator [Solirubrobacteraceae bacterium]